MDRIKTPNLPDLMKGKLYKIGQTRGADDDVIYQNRVNRNSTVLIPFSVFNICQNAPDNNGIYQNGFIVLIKPEDYFDTPGFEERMLALNLVLGINSLLFYETRHQWNLYNPIGRNLAFATSRINPLGGSYVARVPSTTARGDEKILQGYTTSGLKGAGIRVYEYASSDTIKNCGIQLEYVYWNCFDSQNITEAIGMSIEDIDTRRTYITQKATELGLADNNLLKEQRILNADGYTICPLCLDRLSARGFYNRLIQQEGRDVPDLTVTELNLFHIRELRFGEFNHKPYNLGWGHHHCNVVTKDSGIDNTLAWMNNVLERNRLAGYELPTIG